jgi:putative ABC transport system ATP-binding protein
MNTPVIQLSDVRFRYATQDQDILNIPDLQVYQGEHLFIQGSSGSGKTTLLNLIMGINSPYSGNVQVLDNSLVNLSTMQRDQFRVDELQIPQQLFGILHG